MTKCCKFNRQLFEARNMTDLLTVSGNNHLLLEILFARLLFNILKFQKLIENESSANMSIFLANMITL